MSANMCARSLKKLNLMGVLNNMSHLLMNAEADAACGAGYGQRSAVRRHSTLGIMNPND